MEKKILRILSFVMVAAFAFTLMGLAVSAEEWDIPVIEEITEEEMGEELAEEEVVEALEVTEADAEVALYDGTTFKAYYASFEDGIAAVKGGTFEATPEIRLLKDVLLDSSPDTCNVIINTGKEFIVNGANPEGGVFKIEDGNHDWNTDKTKINSAGKEIKTYSIHLEGLNTKLVAKNVTFTRSFHKSYAFFHMGAHARLELSDNAKIGGTAEAYLSGGNGSAVFVEAYGETKSVVAFSMTSDTAVVEYCKGSNTYGAIGIHAGLGTVELEKGTIRNCTDGGGALGIRGSKTIRVGKTFNINNCAAGITVQDNASAELKFYENTISNCAYGIKVGKNALMQTGGSVAITGSTTAGIAVTTGGTVNLNNIIHVENCAKGIDLAAGATLNVNANSKIKGGNYCIYAAAGSAIKLNSPITMSGAKKEGFALIGEDIIEFGSGFSGNIYVTIGYTASGKMCDGFWIGHLAEGVESITGTVYHGITGDKYRGVFYKTLMGSGKATVGENEYSLKSESDGALADNIPDKAVVFNFPFYVKKGNENDGYKRVAAKTFNEAATIASTGETVYLLSDINDNEGISLNATTEVSIDGVKQNVLSHFNVNKSVNINGNGHKITKENSVAKYLFAVYSKAHFNVRNIIFDGNGLGAFAYINPSGGGGTISVDNCIIYNGVGGNAGAFYGLITDKANTATAVINIEDTLIASCTAPNGGAIYTYYNCTVNLENVAIKGCSSTGTGNGGAIYVTSGSKLNVSGKIDISDNTDGAGKENNVYLAGTNQITIAGPLAADSSIGISMAQSGATFGTPADGVTVDKTAFFADGAVLRDYTGIGEYTERRVNAAFYPETVGDGKLNGTAVINTTVLDTRKASRGANELVLHWPYLVEKDNKLYGYKDINTAMTNGNTKNAVIYLQKDITVEHLVGKAVATSGEQAGVRGYTEFTMTGASSSYAHTDLGGHVTLDGNGHVVDVDKKNGSAIFSIQWGNKSLTLNNFIYDGQKPFAVIHKGVAEGNEVINVNNSYMKNPKDYWIFTVGKGGTINITDSTLDGSVEMYGVAATDSAAAFISKFNLSGNTSVNGIGSIKIADAYSVGYINGNYTGNSAISGDISKVKPGENFTALKTAKSITKAGTSGATFAYYDAETGKFGWTAAPVLTGETDAGKYEDGTGVIRFLTTFTTVPATAAVENYGTYAIGVSNFTGDPKTIRAFEDFDTAPTKDGQAFIVDVVNIPDDKLDTNITAISFVKLKGIATPVYLNYDAVNVESAADGGVIKNLVKEA